VIICKMSKLISVIIPHFPSEERRQLLIRNLNGLLNQTASHSVYEIIVVLDGFAEELMLFLTEHYPDITVLAKDHTGVCQTRNLGIWHAKSKYIALIDDDCYPNQSWLENFLLCIAKKPEAYAIGGQTLSSNNKSIFQRYAKERKLLSKPIILDGKITSLITANTIFFRDLLIEIGGFEKIFDTIFKSVGGEDADLSFKIRKQGIELHYCESAIVYHFHRDNIINFINQQYRNGQGIIVHSRYRNISLETLGYPKPRLIHILIHGIQYLLINKDGSPSLIKRTKLYFLNSNLSIGDKITFPIIDLIRRSCYYIGIYIGNRKFDNHDFTNLQ
jgi:GT2 family glycosyltransferase